MRFVHYRDFRAKLATDRDFAAKFKDCATVEALVEAAAREGYGFTAEEVRNNTEILPEELALTAGGLNIAPAPDCISNKDLIAVAE